MLKRFVPLVVAPLLMVGCGRSPLWEDLTDAAELDADGDAGLDGGAGDSGAGPDADGTLDGGDASADTADDVRVDSGADAGFDSGRDTGFDSALDTGLDSGPDSGLDTGLDTGPAAVAFIVTGQVAYEDRVYTRDGFTGELVERPAAGFVVQLLSAGGAVIVEQNTDEAGRFEVAASALPGTQLGVRVLARAQFLEQSTVVRDRSAASAIYSVRTDFGVGDEEGARYRIDVVATADLPVGGAFNIAAVIHDTWATMPDLAAEPQPELTYAWQSGLSWSCGSCYSRNRVQLGGQLEDPDEYDDDIIRHEFGHFWMEHFSDDDSPGGSHRDRVVEPTLAWGEGVAYFLAAVWSGNGWYVDNFAGDRRLVDHETVAVEGGSSANLRGTSGGGLDDGLREEVVSGMLWDAFDPPSPAEPFDTLALGRDASIDVIIAMARRSWGNEGARGIDAADWLVELVCSDAAPADATAAIASGLDYPWAGDAGCGKGGRGADRIPTLHELTAALVGSRLVVDRGDSIREFRVARDGVAARSAER